MIACDFSDNSNQWFDVSSRRRLVTSRHAHRRKTNIKTTKQLNCYLLATWSMIMDITDEMIVWPTTNRYHDRRLAEARTCVCQTGLWYTKPNPDARQALSSQGVRQGDLLGSLLFACAMQTALQKTKLYIQDYQIRAWIMAYHDDTKVLGEPDRLMEVLKVIKHEFTNIDLCIQTEKSRIIDFHWETRSEKYKSDVRALNISVDDKCGIFLGCPVRSTPQEEQSFMHSKLSEQLEVLDRLADPRVPVHQAATILRVSTTVNCRIKRAMGEN
jgi:hypothetical protein